ncbi:FimV/HubP family polar landmark protein [Marinobacter lacisalsi]|uniref:FimV/HubP family polar landmark protein n=1 Tax=Marinobacter lacisalsi TaxID=475979 RepID=A0ABV8QNC9_9GAMM
MKVRKLAVALALAGGLGSGVAQALGLGEIELQSYLNQPLNAEIDVNRVGGVSPGDIIVNLASEQAYERVGLRRDYFLTRLNFEVTTAPNGDVIINVTSSEPVREPYLSFLVEVTWPSGRVMREYSLLVDPPVYAEDSGQPEPVQRSQAGQTASQPRATTQQGSRAPSAAASTTRSTVGDTLTVQASDTLWEIAQRVRPDNNVSMQQVMLAIQDLNPDAFINGNINRIKRGAVLRVPDADQVRSRTQAQANREVAAQNRALAQPEPQVDATRSEVATSAAGDGAAQAGSDELRLVVPEDGDDARSEGSAGGDGRQGGTADAGEAIALEELDRVERENEELNSRVEDLQDQVETLQRLIELKDNQLAEIQGGMAADGEEPVDGAADATVDGSDAAGMEAGTGEPAADEPAATDEESGDMTTAPDGEEAPPADQAMDPELADDEGMAAGEEADGMVAEEDTGMEPQQEEQPADAADGPVAATGSQPDEQQASAPESEPEQEKGFLETAIDLIAGNFLYQIALGGFLVLLLLVVLLISRRRANREDEFYQQLNDHDDDDGFELTLGEEEAAATASALEEADRYVSYGQHDAAAEVLENAISREPSRSDLRLKLLGVYADTGNRAAFDKQYAELDAMELDEAKPEAEALRARLEDVESTPSIDELESQLRGGDSFGGSQQAAPDNEASDIASTPVDDETNELISSFEELDRPEEDSQEPAEESKDDAIEFDFSSLDTSEDAGGASERAGDESEEEPVTRPATGREQDEDLQSIDFELPEDVESSESGTDDAADDSLDLEDDFSSLELDEAGIDSEPAAEDVEGAAEPSEEDNLDFGDLELDAEDKEPVDQSANPEDQADLDESFLDELDAELDKVTSGDGKDDGLEDLELDVSDEDLELMDQASESELEDESQLDLGDLDLDEPDSASAATGEEPAGDDLSDLEIPELDNEAMSDEQDVSPADDTRSPEEGGASIDEIDEASLGDDDDFDFLSGTDEVATKLDLARAYVDMGDSEGAREILEEVILEGNDEQKTDAKSLLKKLP